MSDSGAKVVDGYTAAATDVGWYILGDNQQNLGPYTFFELCDHFRNGYLLETTLVWADGRSEWQPLSAIPELMSRIPGADVGYAAVDRSNAGTNQPKHDTSAFPSTEDEFEKWQKEIKEAEAEAVRLKTGTELVEDGHERASSPPEGHCVQMSVQRKVLQEYWPKSTNDLMSDFDEKWNETVSAVSFTRESLLPLFLRLLFSFIS